MADRIVPYAQRDGKNNLELDDLTPVAKGGKVFRPTALESRKSFIEVQTVGTNMVEYLENAETSDVFQQTMTSQTFVIISGHAVEAESLLEAVDLCFKCFFVLDVNYTKQCLPTCEFLQHAVYGIDGHESSCVKFLKASVFSGHS